MKRINNYIQEKLVINKNTKARVYTCQPKDKNELRKILKERLSKDKNADLNDIDVSQITNMGPLNTSKYEGLFENLDPHNIDISTWDITNVKNMRGMFANCPNFNSNLYGWDMSKVEDTAFMFYECKNFNSDLSNWNVNNVTDMFSMFEGCKKFNSNLSNWDVSSVENMGSMFNGCTSLKNIPSWYHE